MIRIRVLLLAMPPKGARDLRLQSLDLFVTAAKADMRGSFSACVKACPDTSRPSQSAPLPSSTLNCTTTVRAPSGT